MAKLSEMFRGNKQMATLENLAAVVDATVTRFTELSGRVKSLEDELAALRSATDKSMKYCGVFQGDRNYFQGDFITFKGSGWICRHTEATGPPPGNGWQLAIKSGRE